MKLRTIKILALSYCLCSSALLTGQEGIHLDRNKSVGFLEKIYSSAEIWKNTNDPLREAISQLVCVSTKPPLDSTIMFLSGYDFKKITIPVSDFYIFETIRITLPHFPVEETTQDTIGTPPVRVPYNDGNPFLFTERLFMGDTLEAAVKSLIGYLEARDSTNLRVTSETGRGTNIWLNSRSGNLFRFWLPDGKGDSVTVWIGSPQKNTLSLRAEEGVQFRRQKWYDKSADARLNVTTATEESLRQVALRKIKPDYWKFRSDISFLLSQGVVSHWAKGGENNVVSVLDITSSLIYTNKETNVNSLTTVRTALGLQAAGKPMTLSKNLDVLEINSKIGHKAFGKFDLSGLFQFKTQFLPGYDYPNDSVKVSKFFNPATLIIGYGLEYKPEKNTVISFSPLSYRGTYVTDTATIDQTKFGIASDKKSKNEMGAYLTVSSKFVLFEKININSRLQLFSSFLSNPQNIDVDWETIASTRLNWFTDLRVNLHLIYDDDTRFPVLNNEGIPVVGPDGKEIKAPKLQFKELLGVSFVFRF